MISAVGVTVLCSPMLRGLPALVLAACVGGSTGPKAAVVGAQPDTAYNAGGDGGDSSGGDSSTHSETGEDTGTDIAPVWDCSAPLTICAAGTCAIAADAKVVTLYGTTRFNGALPDPARQVHLFDPTTGTQAQVDIVDGAFEARLWPSDWVIDWEAPDGARVGSTAVRAADDVEVALTDEREHLTGTATWLGAPILPRDIGTDYAVGFDGEESWGSTVLDDGTWEAWVPRGPHDVTLKVWEHGLSSGQGPAEVGAIDVTGPLTLALDATAASLAVEVHFESSSGEVASELAGLEHDSARWSERLVAGRGVIDAPLGEYSLWAGFGSSSAGDTYGNVVIDTLTLSADASVAYSVELFTVGGLLSVEGLNLADDVPLTACPTLTATEFTSGEVYTSVCPGSLMWEMVLPAGSYDFAIADDGWPQGFIALADSVLIEADTELDLMARLVPVTGTVRFDGGAPPLAEDGSGLWWALRFTDLDHNRDFTFSFEGAEPWSALVPEGRYDVRYSNSTPAFGTLRGELRVAENLDTTGGTSLDVDVVLSDVSVTTTLEGAIPNGAKVALWGEAAHQAWLDPSGAAVLRVPPGQYALVMEPDSSLGLTYSWLLVHPCVVVE